MESEKSVESGMRRGSCASLALENAAPTDIINVTGHKQEMDRIFNPLSIIATAITTGNVWVALAGTIVGSAILHASQIPI
jgi:hypothetical protein